MTDKRVRKFAKILVDVSAQIVPGDRVLLEATTAASPLVEALYEVILERGGHPHPLLALPRQEQILLTNANENQLMHTPIFRKFAYDEFESRIRIHSATDTEALNSVDPGKQALRKNTEAPILATQLKRGAAREFKWVTTLFPTEAYAKFAGMSLSEYEDFVYAACHADDNTPDPIAYWQQVKQDQERYIELFAGGENVLLRGPNVDISLSIKDRKFINACGESNMPDGEIFTGPVEDSVNGWVRYTYPSIKDGRVIEDIELMFVEGKVEKASAKTNQDFLLMMLDKDAGSRYVGEFAIGTNFEITRFTGQILYDEKIGGSFHMALGAGYPETGSTNKSAIHWDMICNMREDSEILVDGEIVYKNGKFVF